MRIFYSTLLLLVSLSSSATDWSDGDKYRAYAFVGLSYIDYKQTVFIAEHPEKFFEKNTFLGRHPSKNHVTNHFILNTTTNLVVTNYLPTSYEIAGIEFNPRSTWQYLSIASEVFYIVQNKKLGININF